jgi:uncharacterized membrane protein (UPF0127 family)
MANAKITTERGRVVARDVRWARTALRRSKGLLGEPKLQPGEALVFEPGRQVHTFGMHYPIDVVFCDRDWVIVHVARAMPPMRVGRWVRKARYAIELPDGAAADLGVGDRLRVDQVGGISSRPVK